MRHCGCAQATELSSNAEANWRSVDTELARRRAGLQQGAEVRESWQTSYWTASRASLLLVELHCWGSIIYGALPQQNTIDILTHFYRSTAALQIVRDWKLQGRLDSSDGSANDAMQATTADVQGHWKAAAAFMAEQQVTPRQPHHCACSANTA